VTYNREREKRKRQRRDERLKLMDAEIEASRKAMQRYREIHADLVAKIESTLGVSPEMLRDFLEGLPR
jgi:hypothetical protein